jgi:CzcA family heavy metal efflux pump
MNFFDRFVRLVLSHRVAVLIGATLFLIYGSYITVTSPVDILPDLNRPTVTIFSEAEGLATEEVETLVSLPIESVMNGAPNVERVRSVSAPGLSLVFVEFDWGMDIYLARQIISEKLQSSPLPPGVEPELGPISSIMGEIQLVGLSSKTGETNARDLRTLADWTIRPKLLTVSGVAQVTVLGGEIQEYQVLVDPVRLANAQMTIAELEEKLTAISENKSGGFVATDTTEYPIRIIGRTSDVGLLGNTVIAEHEGALVYLRDVATVRKGAQVNPRGDASVNGKAGVVMSITKQPGVNTVDLTQRVEEALASLEESLGDDVEIHPDLFKQEKFIENGIDNVVESTRDAAIFVILVLIFFLGFKNWRAIVITLVALPFSFISAIVILRWLGIDINVMTLGGLAVAIGELTDDALVDVENIIRWLKENRTRKQPLSVYEVVVRGSSEVRGSIIFSTVLIVLVFIPLLSLSNIEGRLLAPLAIAYIIALLSSTLVAMTITVILSYYLLPRSRLMQDQKETWIVRSLKRTAEPIIRWNIRRPHIGVTIILVSIVVTTLMFMRAGKEFLPPFNEGTLTIAIALPPEASIINSREISASAEQVLLGIEGVKSVARRTGRAEEDEHANGVNVSELEVDIDLAGRNKDEIIADVKTAFASLNLEGANVSIGQPISHRIEHLLSGVRAPLVIKIFGPDLDELQTYANQIRDILAQIPGTLNPVVEQGIAVPQVVITPNRERAAQYGFVFGDLTDILEVQLAGEKIGQILEGSRSFPLVIRLDERSLRSPEDVGRLLIRTPRDTVIPLSAVADIAIKEGRSSISHDNGQRRVVISSGILDGDSVTIIEALKERVSKELKLPQGYFLSYEGTYQSQQESSRKLIFYSILAFIGVIGSLYFKFRSMAFVLQVLIIVPVTYLGGMIAILFAGNIVNLASLVGLISLLGVAARNGILLIEHYIYQATEEGMPFSEELIVHGSLNRITPMVMTSATTLLALIPLIMGAGKPGTEILYPLGITMFGGSLLSLIVEIMIRPGLFMLLGRKALLRAVAKHKLEHGSAHQERAISV